MKIVYGLDGDVTIPVVYTSGDGSNPAMDIEAVVGVGNPFYAFESLPEAVEGNIAWDPDGAPLCTADILENQEAIDDMLADPPLSKVREA
jgi:hypothetical protein